MSVLLIVLVLLMGAVLVDSALVGSVCVWITGTVCERRCAFMHFQPTHWLSSSSLASTLMVGQSFKVLP